MTWKRIAAVYKVDPAFQLPYQLSSTELSTHLYLKPEAAAILYRYLQKPADRIAEYLARDINVLTPFMKSYPARLQQIYDPPWILYAKGNTDLLHKTSSLGVVGTRTPTAYGIEALNHLLPPVIGNGTTIISGLARGTDSLAHKLTVRENGKTIAVLGSGFDHIYPRENAAFARHLAVSHLLLSEYPPFTPPRKWQFPARNRIISGISDAVFISEAAARSGSLITAYQALEQGRDVLALPGSILSPMSEGTNQLIKEGAVPVTGPEDL